VNDSPRPVAVRLVFVALRATVLVACFALPAVSCQGLGGGAGSPGYVNTGSDTAVATRGSFVRSVRVSGTVEAVQSFVAMTPRLTGAGMNTLVITRLVPAGTRVKRGDLLVEFDRQSQLRAALDRQNEFDGLEAQIRRKEADQQAALAGDESELRQAENSVERTRLDLLKNEMLSAIAAEKNQQAYEEAEARLKALRETFDLKRAAARADLRMLQIQRDRAHAAMIHARENAARMTIVAPLEGLVVPKQVFRGSGMGEVQEGEQVRAGVPILEVVSATGMQVRARVNQLDAEGMQVGQPAAIRLDAYPGKVFEGDLVQLAPIALASDMSPKIRTFVALFSIDGSDPALMPDLTAAVDVEVERLDEAVLVPRDAVFHSGEGWTVTVRSGGRDNDRPVSVRAMNEKEVALDDAVAPGTVLVKGQRHVPKEK
jgi:multidrug resistance efflux pump